VLVARDPKRFAQPSVFIIGLGVSIPDHTTVEAYRVMESCARLYSIVQEPSLLWLPKGAAEKVQVVNVLPMYTEGALRTDNYERVARTIIDSIREIKPVGYVTYGNPLSYDSVAQNVIRYAVQSGISFRVVPGISSIDTLLCDLGVDMAPGLQIYEASWVVAAQVNLRTDVATVLLQIGAFGSFRAYYRTPPSAASLVDLASYLTRFYPASHRVFLVRSSSLPDSSGNVRALDLKSLCAAQTEDILNASMYIPALRNSDLDKEIISKMEQA
jgi:precorrin-2 methylase